MSGDKEKKLQDKFRQILRDGSGIRAPYFSPDDEAGFAAAHRSEPVTSVRVNPKKATGFTEYADQVPWYALGYYLPSRPLFTADPLFHAGAYYVQEASSMFTGYAFEQLMKDRDGPVKVLDLCAAPGGKSTLLASLLEDDDLLLANEVIQPRASILAENLTRWGYLNTWVSNNDPRDFSRLTAYFDCILIDAPCTGSGLWRKDEDAMEEWSEEHVRLCSERQKRIIADALPALKDGGILLYATCSYSPEENEMIADWICTESHAESLQLPTPEAWGVKEVLSPLHGAYSYRFYPWKVKGEGFFLSAFRISNESASPRRNKSRHNKQHKADSGSPWKQWLDGDFAAIDKNGEQFAINPAHIEDYELLTGLLRIKKGGVRLGKALLKEVIPDHELALCAQLSHSVPSVALEKEEALQYLKKEEIKRDGLKGWHIVKYQGIPLGWGKWMPGRMNNYLPKSWRIRMDI